MIRSLRLRLLAGAFAWIVLALALAGTAIAIMFTGNVEQTVRRQLAASLTRLVALIEPGEDAPRLSATLADPRYDTPQSGAYWQVEDLQRNAILRSRSLWDHVIELPATEQTGELWQTVNGPDGQRLATLSRQVRFSTVDGPRLYRVTLGEDRRILDESIARFGADLFASLAVLGIVLTAAAWLQVHLGLQPLRRLREGIEAIRNGRERRLPADYPNEVAPLVTEVNELLTTQERVVEHARARAADLAHGLKTPLAALQGMASDLAAKGVTDTAATIEEIAREMSGRIDYQLRLARLRLRNRDHRMQASLRDTALRTVMVLQHSAKGERLSWDVELDEDYSVDLEPGDLGELLGVLLENAVEWARSTVVMRARVDGDRIVATIADDGPGIPEADAASLGERGRRLDESTPGSGLGLAIAKEIVGLNGGELELGSSTLGGLEVRLDLPSSPRPHRR